MLYPEFEELKEYQHNREPLHHKFVRRAQGDDRGARNPTSFFNRSRRAMYAGLALSTTGIEIDKRLFRRLPFYNMDELYQLDRREFRADIARRLYDFFIRIVSILEEAAVHVLGPLSLENLLRNISVILENNAFEAQPSIGRSESLTLKPLVIQAILKMMTLLLDHPQYANFFDILPPNMNADMRRIMEILPDNSTEDQRILAIIARYSLYYTSYTLTEYMTNPTLQPRTIPQLAFKLTAKYMTELAITQADVVTMLREYCIITRQAHSVLNNAFITTLINSADGTVNQGVTLRSNLPENPEAFIRDAIAVLDPIQGQMLIDEAAAAALNQGHQILAPAVTAPHLLTLQDFTQDSNLKPKTISELAIKLSLIYFNTLDLTQEKIAEVINEYLIATEQEYGVLDEQFIASLIESEDGDTYLQGQTRLSRGVRLKSHLPENPEAHIRGAIAMLEAEQPHCSPCR